jgi:succinate dehydrogenase/fumarate reductase cytochrome b subunit
MLGPSLLYKDPGIYNYYRKAVIAFIIAIYVHFYILACAFDGILGIMIFFLRPSQELFTYMEVSPLTVKGCKI